MNQIDNRQIRVFISSTFRDMQDERDELMKKTFPMLRQMAAERDVTLTEIDLRWGITEKESKSGKVVEICLREIENSIPFFIGIIGNRYGWIPKREDIGGGSLPERFPDVPKYVEQHLSVTEMEMQFGVLARPEDMHAYFFIKEPEIPDEEEPEKLDALKKAVWANKRYPVSNYSSREDLARQVEEAFRKLLDDLFPEGALSALEKERLGQRAYMNSLCQNYIRTEKNFAAIDEWMKDWDKHQLVITGASGLGKSALVANWTKDKLTKEKDLPYKIIYHAVGSGGSLGSDWHVVKSLCDEIRDQYGFDTDDTSPKTDEEALQKLFDRVAFKGDKPLLIVLDAINQIVDVNHAKRLNWLPIPPKNVKILFTTLEDDETMRVFQGRRYPVYTLQPLTREERIQMVRKYLSIFSKKLKPEQVARIVDDRQSVNTLVMKTLLDELVNFGIYERLDEKIEEFLKPDSYEDFYQVLLQNYEASFGEPFVRHFLSLIAVSRNGLSEDEILSIMQVKPLHWSQFFCSFRQHLIVKNGLVSFSHGYIREAVEGRYITANEGWERSCREEIVAALENQKTPEGKKTTRSMDEVPYQLDQLGALSRLHEYLLDVDAFTYLNRYESTTLGNYWRKLVDVGYSLKDYLPQLTGYDFIWFVRAGFLPRWLWSKYHISPLAKDALERQYVPYLLGQTQAQFAGYYVAHDLAFSSFDIKDLKYVVEAAEVYSSLSSFYLPRVADVYDNVGITYSAYGNHQKALDYALKALEIRQSLYGEDSLQAADSYNQVSVTYGKVGNREKAMEYVLKALEIYQTRFGSHCPNVASSYHNLGVIYASAGKYQEALDYSLKALEICRALFADPNQFFCSDQTYVGSTCLMEYGDPQTALDLCLTNLESYLVFSKAPQSVKNYRVASDYQYIGFLYEKLGNHQKALEYASKAQEIPVEFPVAFIHNSNEGDPKSVDNNPDMATSYEFIGFLYEKLGNEEVALEYTLKALEIRRAVFGKNHLYVLAPCNQVSRLYRKLGDYPKAMEYAQVAQFIYTLWEDCVPDGAMYDTLAFLSLSNDHDYEKALEYAKKALEIRIAVLGDNHPDVGDSYDFIASIYESMGNNQLAEEYQFRAFDIWYDASAEDDEARE